MTDKQIQGLMEEWGLRGEVQPVPCPRCGNAPTLEVTNVGRSLVAMRFVCRRWLGLRECVTGPAHYDEYDWQDYGRRGAATKWNRFVAAWTRAARPTEGKAP